MWKYRELIKNLTIVDLKDRYQNTTLGFFWSILSPFLLAMVLYFVFRNLYQQEDNFPENLRGQKGSQTKKPKGSGRGNEPGHGGGF